MSQIAEQNPADNSAASRISGLHDLYPRQMKGHIYRVLSLRNEENTAHEVDLEDLSCTCEDLQYNRDGHEVCDHLAAALYQAPATVSLDESAPYHLRDSIERAEKAASVAESAAQGIDDALAGTRAVEADEAASESPDPVEQEPAGAVGVSEVREFIETVFSEPQLVEIEEGTHDETPGVILQPDNQSMADHVYESFKGIVGAVDDSTTHVGFLDEPCGTCGGQDGEFWYHIPADTEDDVFA